MAYTPIRDLIVGRLGLPTVDANISELLGSEVTATGDSTAVGQRRVKMFSLVFPIHGTPGDVNPALTGNRMRRQIRSFAQNSQYRLSGVYVKFLWDPERNGFVVIGTASLADADGGPIFGDYTFTIDNAFRVAALNTHRDGYRVALTDMRLTSSPVDYLGSVINTAAMFAGLTPLQVLALPVGATDATVLDTTTTGGVRVSADGSIPVITGRAAYGPSGSASALVTGDVVSWERPESSFNLGDVVAYDRRGFTGPNGVSGAFDKVPFPADVQTSYGWEEIYGPDYPYNWLTVGQPMDAPVLSNGLCRIRLDVGATYAGFIVDAWNPATSAYVEQGKVGVRNNSNSNPDTIVLSAGVVEYTPDRAVVQAVLSTVGGTFRERVYITLQRGWTGPRLEVYSNGTQGAVLVFQVPTGEVNSSVMKNEGVSTLTGATFLSSASGSSTSPFVVGTQVGATGYFPGENFLAMLRQGRTHQLTFAVLTSLYVNITTAYSLYSAPGNEITFEPALAPILPVDYVGAHLGFVVLQAWQIAEAEAIRRAGTTAQVTDATASGGFAVSDTQTAATAVTLTEATTAVTGSVVRLFARVKVGTSGATGSWKWALGNVSAVTTSTATAWTWLDLGEVTVPNGTNPALTVTGWRSAGSGNVQIDRIEAVVMHEPTYAGARDTGSAELLAQIVQGRKVSRA